MPVGRWQRWVDGFTERHGATRYDVRDATLRGDATDGSWFRARLPFGRDYSGPAEPEPFGAGARAPDDWGIVLVRKGGFAIARMRGSTVVVSKVGQRHVQGRTKAGGQSQQRFARRRANQARDAYEAAADHAARILLAETPVPMAVTGGDRAAVDAVLADPRLSVLSVVAPWLPVPDPRRAVLDQALRDASSLEVDVLNAPEAAAAPPRSA